MEPEELARHRVDAVEVEEEPAVGAELAERGAQVGAVPVAAYLNRDLPAGPTVAVVSGGNIEPKLFAELVGG